MQGAALRSLAKVTATPFARLVRREQIDGCSPELLVELRANARMHRDRWTLRNACGRRRPSRGTDAGAFNGTSTKERPCGMAWLTMVTCCARASARSATAMHSACGATGNSAAVPGSMSLVMGAKTGAALLQHLGA